MDKAFLPFVPAEAGTQERRFLLPKNWIPAYAGTNGGCAAGMEQQHG